MTVAEKNLYKPPKISEMEDFFELKQYACAKVGHMKDWYLQCVDCAQQKKCAAGTQAIRLMENTTSPKPEIVPDPKKDLRGYIEYVFTRKDPVRYLLENAGNIKPQSVYQRVHLWKKNYPDLEERFSMLEKFRFLWTKPWDSMKIPDILKKMEAEKSEDIPKEDSPATDFHGKYADIEVVDPIGKPETEEIPLEDFLKEIHKKQTVKEEAPVIIAEIPRPTVGSKDISRRENTVTDTVARVHEVADRLVSDREDDTREAAAGGGESGKLEDMLQKLRKNIADYQQKIKQAEDQISAILTVQQLMRDGV